MIHRCPLCDYITEIKCNMKRHCIRKHNYEYEKNNINSKKMDEKTILEGQKTVIMAEKTTLEEENTILDGENTIIKYKCNKCYKILSSNKSLNIHSKTCKGIKNPLECHICHKVFANSGSKSKHLKKCKENSLQIANSHNTTQIINNNNNITNNYNYGTINNINIVVYKEDESDFFKTDHLENSVLKNILKLIEDTKNDNKKVKVIENYFRKIFTDPVNRCIKKHNLRAGVSSVHIGENQWITQNDIEIYPKLTNNIAQGFSDLISYRNGQQRIISQRKLDELKAFLDYMADEEGYRNDPDENVNIRTKILFKTLVKTIRNVVFDVTKIII